MDSKLLTHTDINFLTAQTLGTFLVFDGILANPTVWAACITLFSTLITVGFNLYKLRVDNRKDEEKPKPKTLNRKKRRW